MIDLLISWVVRRHEASMAPGHLLNGTGLSGITMTTVYLSLEVVIYLSNITQGCPLSGAELPIIYVKHTHGCNIAIVQQLATLKEKVNSFSL